MKRRHTLASIIVTGVVALLLIELANETPKRKDAAIPEPEAAAPEKPAAAVVATMTLPPPPAPPPDREITPLARSVPTPPVQEIEPLKQQSQPPVQEVEPIKQQPPVTAEATTIEPLQARQPETPTPAPTPAIKAEAPLQPPQPQETRTAVEAGRPLLKMMELGEGPSIEISWPRDSRVRADLYRVFSRCYGMRVALMTAAGSLYDEASDPGRAWPINTDRFSGFLRRSQGGATTEERGATRRIKARHGLSKATAVRVFPRKTDAALLGGLKSLTGEGYGKGRKVRAAYQLSGWRVGITAIHVDSRPVAGVVDLSGAARSGCRI